MEKKKILTAGVFIAIVILAPLNAIANEPVYKQPNITANDPVFESASNILTDQSNFIIPDYIDITGLKCSEEELSDFKKQAEYVNELTSTIENYIDEDLTVVAVPILQEGEIFTTVSIINMDMMSMLPVDWECANIFLSATYLSAMAAIYGTICAYLTKYDPENAGAWCFIAGIVAGEAILAWAYYAEKCGSNSGSSAQTTIETIMNGGTVEISEILSIADLL